MILSLCLITKGDEELKSVKIAVGSLIAYVDSVYITTNSDKYSKTKDWCDSNKKIEHSHLPWDKDFSKQRNFNFSQVRSDTDFILWADSDDFVVNASLIREVAQKVLSHGHDTVFFPYWYGAKFNGKPSIDTLEEVEITHNRERLIRPGSIVWQKRIHETPVPLDPERYIYSKVNYEEYPIAWLHLGADRDLPPEKMKARIERNEELLRLELAEEGADRDPRTVLYLMKILCENEDKDVLLECINLGDEYLNKSGWDQERAVCYQIMSKCAGILGKHESAKELLLGAISEYPEDPLSYFYLARACFNLKDYRAMKHWMGVGFSIDPTENNTGMNNILELKVISAELMFQYNYHAKRDVRAAHKAAEILAGLVPSKQNFFNESFTYNQAELDRASEHAHKLMDYCVDIQREGIIPQIVKILPEEMQKLPFALKYFYKYSSPRVWGTKEICYFANFGGNHFEKWDGNSLKKGIGGSETAVIRLSEEWVKAGFKVTVYGDPELACVINDVSYLPWYAFNRKDKFNIFIQWRDSSLAKKISAKKFMVDLHDVFDGSTHKQRIDQIDRLMVKSNYHKDFAVGIPSEKVKVVSNGIR